jgi:hypothetical protein
VQFVDVDVVVLQDLVQGALDVGDDLVGKALHEEARHFEEHLEQVGSRPFAGQFEAGIHVLPA